MVVSHLIKKDGNSKWYLKFWTSKEWKNFIGSLILILLFKDEIELIIHPCERLASLVAGLTARLWATSSANGSAALRLWQSLCEDDSSVRPSDSIWSALKVSTEVEHGLVEPLTEAVYSFKKLAHGLHLQD